MKKKLLVFDHDGTIHDTMRIYGPAFRSIYKTLVKKGLASDVELSDEKIGSYLGMNVKDMWEDFMPQLPTEERQKAASAIGRLMMQYLNEGKARWYQGTEETLEILKQQGYHMVILSNCETDQGRQYFEAFQMERFFDKWYDCETYDFAPKSEIIKEIQKDYEKEIEQYIVIGDRDSDREAALSINCPFIGCLYGFAKKGELDDSDALIENITCLPEAIEKVL